MLIRAIDVDVSRRVRTPEGMLRVPAVIAMAGVARYDAGDVGIGPAGKHVNIDRTRDSLAHADTLASILAAPITVGHPPNGVSPKNWNETVVGNVASNPTIDTQGRVHADLLIGDEAAIQQLEAGKRELSMEYSMRVSEVADDPVVNYRTSGGYHVNHIALVDRGRSGPQVRVADSGVPLQESRDTLSASSPATGGDDDMQASDIQNAVKAALTDALKDHGGQNQTQAAAITDAVTAAMKPVLDQMQTDARARDEAAQTARAADAKKRAEEAATKLESAVRADMRDQFAVLQDVATIMPAEALEAVKDKPVKDILVAALKDVVPNAADMSEDVLRGALLVAKQNRPAGGAGGGTPNLPAGVAALPGKATDAVATARDEMKRELEQAYLNPVSDDKK